MNKRKYTHSKHWVSYSVKIREYKLAWHYFKRAITSLFEMNKGES